MKRRIKRHVIYIYIYIKELKCTYQTSNVYYIIDMSGEDGGNGNNMVLRCGDDATHGGMCNSPIFRYFVFNYFMCVYLCLYVIIYSWVYFFLGLVLEGYFGLFGEQE